MSKRLLILLIALGFSSIAAACSSGTQVDSSSANQTGEESQPSADEISTTTTIVDNGPASEQIDEQAVRTDESATTTTLPTPDPAGVALPEGSRVFDESRAQNTNTGSSPIRRLCWITREVGLQIVQAAVVDVDRERSSDQQELNSFVNSELDTLLEELDALIPQLDRSVRPFAAGLSEELAAVSQSARVSPAEELLESPLFDIDFDAVPNQDEYGESATAAGCEQPA